MRRVLSVPFPQLRVLRLLADDRVLPDGVAAVIHYRSDLHLSVRLFWTRQCSQRIGGQRQPCDHASSCDRNRNVLCHARPPSPWDSSDGRLLKRNRGGHRASAFYAWTTVCERGNAAHVPSARTIIVFETPAIILAS